MESQEPSLAAVLAAVEAVRIEHRDFATKVEHSIAALTAHAHALSASTAVISPSLRPADPSASSSVCGSPGRSDLANNSFRIYTAGAQEATIESDSEGDVLSTSPALGAARPPNIPSAQKHIHHQREQQPKPLYNHRIVLTTYPGQVGINPIPLNWGDPDPARRGPIIASRNHASLRLRNAIGAHGGAYSIYRALAVAMRQLEPTHRPNLTNTGPVVRIGPHPSWSDPTKIVSLDPWGHIVQDVFADRIAAGLDVRPTIAITKAHMQLAEIEACVRDGSIAVDGKIVLDNRGQLMVVKGAVEPVWFLPGIAQRFGCDETTLRRCLFEDTGGMYPELITRPDLKVFLPPIGGLSIYIFGPPEYISDPTKLLTLRVHDECNGSDVFGSDICTCRPYLIYGIEECVRAAQSGKGVGVVVYFRKEGRALGEVTKYLVYNARKRAQGGDTAQNYFLRTEDIAGVKDMRFQATMPDVLHWLGIQKIDRMVSMSNMKYDAIVGSGIPIHERVEIPGDRLPPDSQVEIDAKIAAGYFSASKNAAELNLSSVKGRTWEDVNH